MLHTSIHQGPCVAIQHNTSTLIINPIDSHIQQKDTLLAYPNRHIVTTPLENPHYVWESYVLDAFSPGTIRICVGGFVILYHQHDHSLSQELLGDTVDLFLVDLTVGMDVACSLAACVQAKIVVPLGVQSTDDPVGFCREIMLNRRGVPKYLKHGQYVVLA